MHTRAGGTPVSQWLDPQNADRSSEQRVVHPGKFGFGTTPGRSSANVPPKPRVSAARAMAIYLWLDRDSANAVFRANRMLTP